MPHALDLVYRVSRGARWRQLIIDLIIIKIIIGLNNSSTKVTTSTNKYERLILCKHVFDKNPFLSVSCLNGRDKILLYSTLFCALRARAQSYPVQWSHLVVKN